MSVQVMADALPLSVGIARNAAASILVRYSNSSAGVDENYIKAANALLPLYWILAALAIVTFVARLLAWRLAGLPFGWTHVGFLLLVMALGTVRILDLSTRRNSEDELVQPGADMWMWNLVDTCPLIASFTVFILLMYHVAVVLRSIHLTYEVALRGSSASPVAAGSRHEGNPLPRHSSQSVLPSPAAATEAQPVRRPAWARPRCAPHCQWWFLLFGRPCNSLGLSLTVLNIFIWVLYVVAFFIDVGAEGDSQFEVYNCILFLPCIAIGVGISVGFMISATSLVFRLQDLKRVLAASGQAGVPRRVSGLRESIPPERLPSQCNAERALTDGVFVSGGAPSVAAVQRPPWSPRRSVTVREAEAVDGDDADDARGATGSRDAGDAGAAMHADDATSVQESARRSSCTRCFAMSSDGDEFGAWDSCTGCLSMPSDATVKLVLSSSSGQASRPSLGVASCPSTAASTSARTMFASPVNCPRVTDEAPAARTNASSSSAPFGGIATGAGRRPLHTSECSCQEEYSPRRQSWSGVRRHSRESFEPRDYRPEGKGCSATWGRSTRSSDTIMSGLTLYERAASLPLIEPVLTGLRRMLAVITICVVAFLCRAIAITYVLMITGKKWPDGLFLPYMCVTEVLPYTMLLALYLLPGVSALCYCRQNPSSLPPQQHSLLESVMPSMQSAE